MTFKICVKCRKEKHFSRFGKNKANWLGLELRCKDCETQAKERRKEASRQYYHDHKQACKDAQKRYQQTLNGRLSRCFSSMKQRCNNPKNPDYKYFGGRGIKCLFISSDWFVYYVKNILGYTTPKSLEGLELGRIDNDGHYQPGNIRFVTHAENNQNTKRRIRYGFSGEQIIKHI